MASKIKVDQIEGSTGSTITIPTGQTFTVTDGIPVASGGTGLASFTAGDILYATGATTLTKLNKGTAEQVLAMNSGATAPDWGSVDLTVLPTITVAKGGTNIASFAAGDILYATGSTTLAKLVKGSAADVLTMNAGATAPEWAASAGGGKIGQIVSAIETARITTSSTTAVTTGLAVTITPTATSSKVWLVANIGTCSNSLSNNRTYFTIVGGNAATYKGDAATGHECSTSVTSYRAEYALSAASIMYLDSPAADVATTYTLYYWGDAGTTAMNAAQNVDSNSGNSASSITAMEVLA